LLFLLTESCFSKEQNIMQLAELAQIVIRGRHRIYVSNDKSEEYSAWLTKQSKGFVDEWQLALDFSVEQEAREPARSEAEVVDSENSASALSLIDAVRLARDPFRIFVENDESDKNFLLSYSSNLQKRRLRDLEENGLVRFEHCGGITLIPQRVPRYVKASSWYCKNSVAVFDSDALQPNIPSTQSNAALHVCQQQSVKAFRLQRRAIENYIQKPWINTWVNNKPRGQRKVFVQAFQAFCSLNSDQAAHFNMKHGFSGDQKVEGANAGNLYNGIAPQTLSYLKNGFGNNLATLYAEDWVQAEKNKSDGAWNEVNSIVTELLALLR
jgi:hypothetical protein